MRDSKELVVEGGVKQVVVGGLCSWILLDALSIFCVGTSLGGHEPGMFLCLSNFYRGGVDSRGNLACNKAGIGST